MWHKVSILIKQNKFYWIHKFLPSHLLWLHQVWRKMSIPSTYWNCCGILSLHERNEWELQNHRQETWYRNAFQRRHHHQGTPSTPQRQRNHLREKWSDLQIQVWQGGLWGEMYRGVRQNICRKVQRTYEGSITQTWPFWHHWSWTVSGQFLHSGQESPKYCQSHQRGNTNQSYDPSFNRNIGKYQLPHIWDEVLVKSQEL